MGQLTKPKEFQFRSTVRLFNEDVSDKTISTIKPLFKVEKSPSKKTPK